MGMTNLQRNSLKELASDVNRYFTGRKVHFFGMDYSGEREMYAFLDAINKYETPAFTFTASKADMSGSIDVRLGIRFLEGLEDYTGDDETMDFIAVENSVHTGLSAVSGVAGILYGIHERIIPDSHRSLVYLMTTENDDIGLSNFAAAREFPRYVGVRRYMRSIAPAAYMDLEELGMIPRISEREHAPRRQGLLASYATLAMKFIKSPELEEIGKTSTVTKRIETDADFVKGVLRGESRD